MSHEQYLTLDLIARLAGRFGPTSRVARELPGWLEYLTEVDCPERPRSRPGAIWWTKIRQISRNLVPKAGGGDGEILNRNCAALGAHFGLSQVDVGILTFAMHYKVFDGFEHVVDGALDTKEVMVSKHDDPEPTFKLELSRHIGDAVDKIGLSTAVDRSGLDGSYLGHLAAGNVRTTSVWLLMHILASLGHDITITVTPKDGHGAIRLVEAS